MTEAADATISVIISTFQRPDACERALRSALEQSAPALEILICDDGSSDDTPSRLREWEQEHPQVRYLRLERNTGTPAAARNLGIAHAQADWVAFLDDDDEWLPEKLARQRAAIAQQAAVDVLATNALRSDGSAYFQDAPAQMSPTRAELLAANPVITSSALVRRSLANFPEARWMRGIEDYAAWLSLADGGSRFLVLGEPLVRYQDCASDRLSTARASRELAVTRLSWQRACSRPFERAKVRTALRRTAGALHVASSDGVAAVRDRRRGRP